MTPGTSTRPATREVLAAAILGVVGALGVFLPFAVLSILSLGLVGASHGPSALGPAAVRSVVLGALSTPAVCLVAIAAAVGLYRGRRWGRRLALIVSAPLAAAPLAALQLGTVPLGHDGSESAGETIGVALGWLLDLIRYHLFLAPLGGGTLLGPPLAALIVWGLLSGRHGRQGASTAPAKPGADGSGTPGDPRRPRLAMLLLAVLGLLAVGPYLTWLVGGRLIATGSAGDPSSGPSVTVPPGGIDFGVGMVVAIPCAAAAAIAILAARSIGSRAAYGPYLATPAAAVAGPWSAVWLLMVGASMLSLDAEGRLPLASVGGWLLTVLALLVCLAVVPVSVGVLRRRAWFRGRGDVVPASPRRAAWSTGRLVASGAIVLLLAPIGVGAVAWAIDPPGEALYFGDVRFQGRAYRLVSPLDVTSDRLLAIGSLDAWTADLAIDDTTVFAVPNAAPERAIAIHLAVEGSDWEYVLFVPSNSVSEGLPRELCPLIPLEDPTVSAVPCGPPDEVRLGGQAYYPTGDGEFEVAVGDLTALGVSVEPDVQPDDRVSLAAFSIRGVPQAEAIVLRAGTRVIVYRASNRYTLGALCRYSPAAVDSPLSGEKEDGGESPPSGCGFPYNVWWNGITYGREHRDDELLDVPVAALAPLGTAEAGDPESADGSRLPFPVTIDGTAYAIAGVDPADAIAFVVGERVLVMRPGGGQLPLPAGLCAYARPDVVQRLESEGEGPVGCSVGS